MRRALDMTIRSANRSEDFGLLPCSRGTVERAPDLPALCAGLVRSQMGLSIGTVPGGARLLVSNAEPRRTSRIVLRQIKSVLDPITHSLRGLNLGDVSYRPTCDTP